MSIIVETPFQNFMGLDGKPLTNGKVYIGQVGTDPTVFANQIPVFWDEALTIPASQPLTTNAGYIVRFGTPARVWVATDYSISVKNASNILVYYLEKFGVVMLSLYAKLSDLASSSGSSLIGFIQSGLGAVSRTSQDKMREFISVKDFGAKGDGVTDDSDAIQAALDSLTGTLASVVLSQNCKYRISKSLIIRRGRSIIADGSPEIIADFSQWTGSYIALYFVVDRISEITQASVMGGFGQRTGGFKITGRNNSGIISHGVRFADLLGAPVASAVNHSYLQGTIEGLTINQFDTGIDMLECWDTTFDNLMIHSCRHGVNIHGKSVNIVFNSPRITNATKDFTSATDDTLGFSTDSGLHYPGGAEGRPEGISIIGGLIYGHDNNLFINRVLSIFIGAGAIIDGASKDCIRIGSPSMVVIKDCYIFTATTNYACIDFAGVNVGSSSQILIEGNQLVGNGVAYGITFSEIGEARKGVKILNNTGILLKNFVYAKMCPEYSEISGNYAEYVDSHLIDIRSGGKRTIVDGNSTISAVFPLMLQPAVDKELKIGTNTSASFSTSYAAHATLAAGATSVSLPNIVYFGGDNYCRALTQVTPMGNLGTSWWVEDQTNWSSATLRLASAVASATKVAYTVISVPFSAE